MREARAAAALRSQHVVQILDHGMSDSTPYIAMELLVGESLRALSIVGWISGGALAAGGLALPFTALATDGEVSVALGPTSFELRRRF